ncbi:uncharacterized protein, partial [Halyomorpha halys]|uniref:uncharacterized protein n=1 Tax=Halyomorpha halys TaxID=286706 RepID=UPI0034D2C5BD
MPEKKPKRQLRGCSSKKVNIGNNSEQLSLANEIVKFPSDLENCLEKKKRGYNRKPKDIPKDEFEVINMPEKKRKLGDIPKDECEVINMPEKKMKRKLGGNFELY